MNKWSACVRERLWIWLAFSSGSRTKEAIGLSVRPLPPLPPPRPTSALDLFLHLLHSLFLSLLYPSPLPLPSVPTLSTFILILCCMKEWTNERMNKWTNTRMDELWTSGVMWLTHTMAESFADRHNWIIFNKKCSFSWFTYCRESFLAKLRLLDLLSYIYASAILTESR